MRFKKTLLSVLAIAWAIVPSVVPAAGQYGTTEFAASGSVAAHDVFVTGLLQLHNFEYDDARASFQAAIDIDPDFTMAYWGLALSYEQTFWHRYDTAKSRAVLAKLGATPGQRAARALTQREKDYLSSIEILFGNGSQRDRDVAYSEALKGLYQKYPSDLDAAALYALSILVTTYGGRDFTRYMQAAAICEAILAKNPRHPGGLHYSIHSYDDPVHAPLGLRAAQVYAEVAPSAVHALHMGAHIYYALGMWELGIDRNVRSFEADVARQAHPDDAYGNQAYHALTWIPYALQQLGKRQEARDRIALIAAQVARFGTANPVHRTHYIATRASYVVDTQEWDGALANVAIDHTGLSPYTVATDLYVQGLVALNKGNAAAARTALQEMGEPPLIATGERSDIAPGLLKLALEGQIEFRAGHRDQGLALLEQAEQIEAALPSEYGPPVPVQPMAELLADYYREAGDVSNARKFYALSLARAVGRARSLAGLAALPAAAPAAARIDEAIAPHQH